MWRTPLAQRYVWREAAATFAVAALLLSALLALGSAATLARKVDGLSAAALWRLAPLLVVQALVYVGPVAALIAATFTFARLAADGEVDAFRAAGIPARRLLPPIAALGLLVTAGLLVVTTHVAPAAQRRMRRAAAEALRDMLRAPPAGAQTIDRGDWRMRWSGVADGRVADLAIFHTADGGQVDLMLAARRASLPRLDEGSDVLVFDVAGADLITLDPEHGRRAGAPVPAGVRASPAGDAGRRYAREERLDAGEVAGFPVPVGHLFGGGRRLEDLTLGEMDGLHDAWHSDARTGLPPRLDDGHIRPWSDRQMATERVKRLALPWAGLCFPLLGAGVGCCVRRRSRLLAFAAAFLPVVAIYYPLLLVGEAFAKEGDLAPLIAFAVPHGVIAALAGVVLVWRCWR